MEQAKLPELFLERLKNIYTNKVDYESVLTSFSQKKSLSIRINTLKATKEDVQKELSTANISFSEVTWYSSALILQNVSTKEITDLSLYKEGKIYIQSLSSMIPAIVLNPTENETVLDIAAAPGSKTSQIAMMMNNKGSIVANDMSHERLYKLKSNLSNLSVTNTQVTNYAGQMIWQKYIEHFDKVLVDAPCSMEGRFNVNDTESFSDWSMKKVKRMAKLQKWILRSAFSATKVGGTIVYSTCTVAPEENEEVISWLLEKEGSAMELEEVVIPGYSFQNGLTQWDGNSLSNELLRTKRITPSTTMEGFYVAKIQKKRSNVGR